MTINLLEELNEKQRQAVVETHPRVCVIAGAGCGKTKTLVGRAIYLLLNKKLNPSSLLILTFAKKAIKEVRRRISFFLKTNYLNVYNFHSFCFNVVNRHVHLLGFSKNKFIVYDQADQEVVVKKILESQAIPPEDKKINDFISLINNIKNKKILNLDLISHQSRRVYEEYQKYLQQNEALDFNDLLTSTIKIFLTKPGVLQEYRRKFRHILIDESQDINSPQWQIVGLLAGEEQSLFIVGDPNQAIYSFQGADPNFLISITKDKLWKTIYLNVNYRSSPNILTLSNSFLLHNRELIQNELVVPPNVTYKNHKVVRISYFSVFGLVKLISFLKEREKLNWSDIAVLYRSNYLSIKIEAELIKKRIPYEILGSFKFTERTEVKNLLALLKTIVYDDDVSLTRFLSWQEKLGQTTIEKLEKLSEEKKQSLFNYLSDNLTSEDYQKSIRRVQRQIIEKLVVKLRDWKKKIFQDEEVVGTEKLIEAVIEDFEFFGYLQKLDNPDQRRNNIKKLVNMAANWEKNYFRDHKPKTSEEALHNFLQWVSVTFEDKELIKSHDNLILSSIHQAKGLEFAMVFFIYLDENIIPHRTNQNLLEERRLFYVGLTRAKHFLYLVSSSSAGSMFLKEIDLQNPKLVENH